MSCSAWSASSHVAGQSLSFPGNGEDCVEEAPLFFTPCHCAQHPNAIPQGIFEEGPPTSGPGRESSLQHTCCLYDNRQDKHRGFSGTSVPWFLVSQCCPQPSVVYAIILASKAPKCPKWQSASSKKDWQGEPQLFCPAWKGQSQFWRQDR